MTVKEFVRCLLGLQPLPGIEEARDIKEFRAAQARLKRSSKAFAKEVSQFGALVVGMRGGDSHSEPPRKHEPPRKTAQKTRKSPSRRKKR